MATADLHLLYDTRVGNGQHFFAYAVLDGIVRQSATAGFRECPVYFHDNIERVTVSVQIVVNKMPRRTTADI